jgi:hypothetical protein
MRVWRTCRIPAGRVTDADALKSQRRVDTGHAGFDQINVYMKIELVYGLE